MNNCPSCYLELEIRDTSPCFVCGCAHQGKELNTCIEKNNFSIYGLKDDTEIILCKYCYLDEVLSNQGALLSDLNINLVNATEEIRFFRSAEALQTKDKYCSQCCKRLSLLKIIASHA